MSAPGAGRRGALAAGFVVLFVGTGVNFAFGILFKSILAELGGDRSTLALAATASLLVNAAGQPAFGLLVDRFGPRRVMLASMALMTVGTALVSQAHAPWQFIALYGVVAAVGYTGCGILPVSIHVSRWFPEERGFVSAVAACGFSLGHLAFTQAAARVADLVGWRETYLLLAAALTVTIGVLIFTLRDAPAAAAAPTPQRPGAAPEPRPAEPSLDRGAALRTPAFWAMTLGLMGCGFTDFLMTTHLPPYATDLGMAPAVAANAVSLWAAANVLGILTAGAVATRVGTRGALVLTYGAPRGLALLPPAGPGALAALRLRGAVRGHVLHDGAAGLDAGRPALRARAPRRHLRRVESLPPQRGGARLVRGRAGLRPHGQLPADLPRLGADRGGLGRRHLARPPPGVARGRRTIPSPPVRSRVMWNRQRLHPSSPTKERR